MRGSTKLSISNDNRRDFLLFLINVRRLWLEENAMLYEMSTLMRRQRVPMIEDLIVCVFEENA